MQGLSLGLNAGLGNLGVSVMQFLIPWVITFPMMGGGYELKGKMTYTITINPQGRVTDHRIGYSVHNLPNVMDGEIADFIEQLQIAENSEKLKEGTE